MTTIRLDIVRTDGGTQPRGEINHEWIAEIAEAIERGEELPPVVIFHDGTDYWLADGFHRYGAHKKLRRAKLEADIRQGTRRDAQLYSCGTNATHGLRRSNADKRRAVETLLRDVQDGCLHGHHACASRPPAEQCWSLLSDNAISRHCSVSQPFVSKLRAELFPSASNNGYKIAAPQDRVRTVERGGTTYRQNTSNIGNTGSKWASRQPANIQAAVAREREEQRRRSIDRSVSQDTGHAAEPASPLRFRAPSPPPTAPIDHVPGDVDEFVDAFCGRLKANKANIGDDVGYFLALARAFPPSMTFADVLQLIERRAAEMSLRLDD